jgi:benzoylformate decarboxylase
VRRATFDLLRKLGMTTGFGNPGSTELSLFLDSPEGFRSVLGLRESVVVGMASRNAAFINLHSAVGVGHAMGAIFTAYKNRTLLVITAGQQSRSILPFDPFLASSRATELPQPNVRWTVEPARAADVPRAIARAHYLAMMPPRGPVLVSAPAEPVEPRRVSRALRPEPARPGPRYSLDGMPARHLSRLPAAPTSIRSGCRTCPSC